MASFWNVTGYMATSVISNRSIARGISIPSGCGALVTCRLPTDSIGNFVLTFTGIVIGSIIRIEVLSTGAEVYLGTATTSPFIVTIPTYVAGSDSNNLRIKIRNASSSPTYKPFEVQTISLVGASNLYITQILDE